MIRNRRALSAMPQRSHHHASVYGIVINGGEQPRFYPTIDLACGCAKYCNKCDAHFPLLFERIVVKRSNFFGRLSFDIKFRALETCPTCKNKLGFCPF